MPAEVIITIAIVAGVVLIAVFGGGIKIGNGKSRPGKAEVDLDTGNVQLTVEGEVSEEG